ncbi:anti-sigma factor [Litorisediminicola beolgyonensis]|uniref:Anti-sigma factor domain-containing protein n=1 Tax=Litorisediminicola beolgyonensis TaxID=1173614 RepID=A0ABW3ZH81_9RHOB
MSDDTPLDPQTPEGPPPGGDSALAAEYVLGLLTEPELSVFERRLVDEPALEAEVIAWTRDLATLAEALPEVAPAPAVKRRLEAAAFGPTRRGGFFASLWPYLGGAVAASLLAWGVFSTGLLTPEAERPLYIADLATEDGGLLIHAGYLASTNEFLIRRDDGAPPEGGDHEMWLLAGEGAPISMGVVPREPGVIARRVLTPELSALLEGGVLAVSSEPAGGSPTGAPTGPVLMTGPITEL